MATIERKPLPPPGRGAITITSTDRADLTNSARDVINHYMFGNGSWWDAGPRKSWDHTVSDLKAFKEAVLGLDQFVDDPDSILPSIKAMIERAIGQANDELKKGWDVDNNIRKTLPDSNDRMEVTPPEPNIQILKPEPRKLSISNAPASGVRADWPSTPARPASFDDRFGDWGASAPAGAPVGASQPTPSPQSGGSAHMNTQNIRVLRRVVTPDSSGADTAFQTSGPNAQPQSPRLLGIVSGKPMPQYPVPPMVFGFSDQSTASRGNMDDWFDRWIGPLMQQ